MKRRQHPIPAPALARGFTLLELVVALALAAVMLTLLLGALRLGTRAWDAVEQRTVRLHDNHLATRFIVRQLEQARPVLLREPNGEQWVGFAGEPGALQFIAPLASHAGTGGLYRLSLDTVTTGDETQRLELSYKLFQTERWERYGTDTLRTIVLYDALTAVDISYFGAPEPQAPARWLSRWHDKEKLPQLVRLRFRLRDDNEAWRELIAAPKITAPVHVEQAPRTRPTPGSKTAREVKT